MGIEEGLEAMAMPGGGARWRAAIARADRTAALRAETRAPREAGVLRAGLWLMVEIVLRAIRPAILVALIAAAAWFGWRGAETAAAEGWSPLPGAMAGADDPFVGADGIEAWTARIEAALSPAPGRPPDLILANAYLAAAPTLLPRQALTRAAGLGRVSEPVMRAAPAWLRERRLRTGRQAALNRFAALGYDPPALALLPDQTRQRRARAMRLYARLFDGLNAAIATGEGVVDLSRAPGFDGGEFRAGAASRGGLDAALLAAQRSGRIDALGARVLRAAHAGGRMAPALEAALEVGADGRAGLRAASAAATLARETSALAAARIVAFARTVGDLEILADRAGEEGLAVLARADRLGPAAVTSPGAPAAPAPPREAIADFQMAASLLGAAALLVVLVVWSSGARGNLPGSGRGAMFDAQLRRFLLGKKDQSI